MQRVSIAWKSIFKALFFILVLFSYKCRVNSFGNFQLSTSFCCLRLIVKIYVLILVGYALQSWEYCQTIRRKQIGWKKSNKGERLLDSLGKCTRLDIFSWVFSFKFQKTVKDIQFLNVSEIIEISLN